MTVQVTVLISGLLVECFSAYLLHHVDSCLELAKLDMFQRLNQVNLISEVKVLIRLQQPLKL